jgi:hypothetical protein
LAGNIHDDNTRHTTELSKEPVSVASRHGSVSSQLHHDRAAEPVLLAVVRNDANGGRCCPAGYGVDHDLGPMAHEQRLRQTVGLLEKGEIANRRDDVSLALHAARPSDVDCVRDSAFFALTRRQREQSERRDRNESDITPERKRRAAHRDMVSVGKA